MSAAQGAALPSRALPHRSLEVECQIGERVQGQAHGGFQTFDDAQGVKKPDHESGEAGRRHNCRFTRGELRGFRDAR